MTAVGRFFAKVQPVESGCWEWAAYRDRDGYGLFVETEGRTRRAHRWAYELIVGPIPDGLHIDHLCRNRCCVNPEHLEPVTNAVNSARSAKATARNCGRGHEFTPENTYVKANGCRACRKCHAIREARYRERKAVA